MSEKLISCLCPTYNRCPADQWLLEEAIMAFLLQDYPRKELIVCNDTPGQTLACDLPGVRMFNLPERFSTLSSKIQWMIEQAGGDMLCRWDDDDISLPHRLSYSLARLGENRWEWRAENYLYCPKGGDPQEVGGAANTHVMSLWRRELLEQIGGYPAGRSGDEDQEFNRALAAASILAKAGIHERGELIPSDEIYYLYRWGVSPRHLSGVGGPQPGHQAHWDAIGAQPVAAGRFELRPHWRENYCLLV